jgi:sugar/nucleoside kinase (ribokinase family)
MQEDDGDGTTPSPTVTDNNGITTTSTTFHLIGDSYVDYICLLAAGAALPGVGEDATLREPMTARAGGSPINTATHLTTLLLRHRGKGIATAAAAVSSSSSSIPTASRTNRSISIQTCFNPNDAMGRILLAHADEFQITLVNDWMVDNGEQHGDGNDSNNHNNKNTSTPHCIVMVTGSERSFLTHRGCAVGWTIGTLGWPATTTNSCAYLHIAGFYCTPEFAHNQTLAQRLRQYRRDDDDAHGSSTTKTIISLVTQYDATQQWDGGLVDDVIPLLDILIMNETEATNVMEAYEKKCAMGAREDSGDDDDEVDNDKSLAGQGDDKDKEEEDVMIEKWRRFYRRPKQNTTLLVVVTMGARGAVALRDGVVVAHLQPPAILDDAVVDTTGAGDAFAAGFLYGHHHQLIMSDGGDDDKVESALAWGCAMGSASVTVVGASVPVEWSLIEHQRANMIQRRRI